VLHRPVPRDPCHFCAVPSVSRPVLPIVENGSVVLRKRDRPIDESIRRLDPVREVSSDRIAGAGHRSGGLGSISGRRRARRSEDRVV
jgi:hypothetical protein